MAPIDRFGALGEAPRLVPYDVVGVDLEWGLVIPMRKGVLDARDDLHVLLRHRPRSISQDRFRLRQRHLPGRLRGLSRAAFAWKRLSD